MSQNDEVAKFEEGLAALPRNASASANKVMTAFLNELPSEMTQGYMTVQYLVVILGAEMASFATKMLDQMGVPAAKVNDLRTTFRAYIEKKTGTPAGEDGTLRETLKRITKDWLN